MSKTTMLIIGGLAVAGIFLIVATSKESTGSAAPSLAAVPPLQVPQYPPAPPMPQFNVEASPSYLYFNVPSNRNLMPTKKNETGGDACQCGNDCGDNLVAQQSLPQSFVTENAKKVAQRFSLGPNPSSMLQQFPPALYPWLYQGGGTA